MVPQGAQREQWHVIKVDQAVAAKFGLVGLDEIRSFRVLLAPRISRPVEHGAAVAVQRQLPVVRIFSPVDHALIGCLQSFKPLRLRSDPEILREAELRGARIGQDDLGERKRVHCADEDTLVPLHPERV